MKLGGLGIMSLSDIQVPALIGAWMKFIADPDIEYMLNLAGILNG
jgi:hypothetical protein